MQRSRQYVAQQAKARQADPENQYGAEKAQMIMEQALELAIARQYSECENIRMARQSNRFRGKPSKIRVNGFTSSIKLGKLLEVDIRKLWTH